MKLLAVVRKLDKNDHLAGFMFRWIEAIAKIVDELKVICLEKGETSGIGNNVEVVALRERTDPTSPPTSPRLRRTRRLRGASRLKEFFKYRAYLKKYLSQVDAVLVFQNPIYATITGFLIRSPLNKFVPRKLRVIGKPARHSPEAKPMAGGRNYPRRSASIIMWYAHGHAGRDLKKAAKYVDTFLTSSAKGFRLETDKPVKIIGQGIDTARFVPKSKIQNPNSKDGSFNIISVGRISPVKDYETLIAAVRILARKKADLPQPPPYKGGELRAKIIGAPGLAEQTEYFERLKQKAAKLKLDELVNFLGAVPNEQILEHLQAADLFVNTSNTGSLDKAVLEAMSAGTLVISCNDAYTEMLRKINPNLVFESGNAENLAENINAIMNMKDSERQEISKKLRQEVVDNHSLEQWAKKIVDNIKSIL